jgi:hypothetical protein
LKTITQENDDVESQVSRHRKSDQLKEKRKQALLKRGGEQSEISQRQILIKETKKE